jgi:dTDP-4-dehydrorhamnose reductase
MRVLVTGVGGLLGSNLAAAAAQQSWSVIGTWRETPVSVLGARTATLDLADRRACVAFAEELEPEVVLHAAGVSSPARIARDPHLAELDLLATENTLAAARAVRARYVLVSCDLVFSGLRPSGECWDEHDPTEPVNALGRSLVAAERLTQGFSGDWLITRPADVYGVNLSIPWSGGGRGRGEAGGEQPGRGSRNGHGYGAAAEVTLARASHIWSSSGPPLRWVAWLRAGQILAAPAGIRRCPTYAWDYAQIVCELIAQECEGIFNTAGPTILGRLSHLRLLARAFGCDLELVREGSPAAFLRACGEEVGTEEAGNAEAGNAAAGTEDRIESSFVLPANTALCDRKVTFMLGRPAVDPFAGHRLMRFQLERLLASAAPAPLSTTPIAEKAKTSSEKTKASYSFSNY